MAFRVVRRVDRGMGVLRWVEIVEWEGTVLVYKGHPIVTSGDFVA